jgi:hypothetical protein
MGQLNQANVAAALSTPLGDSVLALKRFAGSEGRSELFAPGAPRLADECKHRWRARVSEAAAELHDGRQSAGGGGALT